MNHFKKEVAAGIPCTLPPMPPMDPEISRAPARPMLLSEAEKAQALANALRYFPAALHGALAPEFAEELAAYGRIYMHRFRPTYEMQARNIDAYPGRCEQAKAIMMMVQNNLDPKVAQHPYELVTYGGNGTVFQNWAQYLLTMQYLSDMTEEQTLVLYSGHPLGLFPSHRDAPRVVVTNGMVVPNHSSADDYTRLSALGVTSYGQMTAGSFMYIGPQGIVHGTTLTLLNAGRRYLALGPDEGLAGKVFVTSGLGGMSGAQGKAAVIAGAIGVIAEVNAKAAEKRLQQGWVDEIHTDLDALIARIAEARKTKERGVALAYHGNIVDLWEKFADAGVDVELGSDQTSLHIPFTGGYYPVGLSYEESNRLMVEDPPRFKERVRQSLIRHVDAIHRLVSRGMHFWDYGNAFLLEAARAGAANITNPDGSFVYPSYVEDIMGPMCFDYGFGPFRWVCTSNDATDLARTDAIAARVLERMAESSDPLIKQQMLDNVRWIREAGQNEMVVGSQARILYADRDGRSNIATAFNEAIGRGEITAPIVLGRDHHDVSGTDSPYRETANIRDGSKFCADMAVHNFVGDSFRGATWVSLHNGGGVGWGEVINGGFGLVLDGTAEADRRARSMLSWDVSNGLARRAWAGNPGAVFATQQAMAAEPGLQVGLPAPAAPSLVEEAIRQAFARLPSPPARSEVEAPS